MEQPKLGQRKLGQPIAATLAATQVAARSEARSAFGSAMQARQTESQRARVSSLPQGGRKTMCMAAVKVFQKISVISGNSGRESVVRSESLSNS